METTKSTKKREKETDRAIERERETERSEFALSFCFSFIRACARDWNRTNAERELFIDNVCQSFVGKSERT